MTVTDTSTTTAADAVVATLTELFGDKDTKYGFIRGRKYTKITKTVFGQRFVDFFLNEKTGEVLKAAGWASPAKGARYTFDSPAAAAQVVKDHADKHGNWLYLK